MYCAVTAGTSGLPSAGGMVAQIPAISLLLYPPLTIHSGQEAPVSEGLQGLGRHAVPAGSVVTAMLSLRRVERTGGVGRRCCASAAAGC